MQYNKRSVISSIISRICTRSSLSGDSILMSIKYSMAIKASYEKVKKHITVLLRRKNKIIHWFI